MEIREGGLDDPRVLDLLAHHLHHARTETAPGSAHALDIDGLQGHDVDFWTLWEADRLLGMGAIKRLTPDHYEIKSMHTVADARRSGIGSVLLRHIVDEAVRRGGRKVSLETGTWPYFVPAIEFYERNGFVECGPFADYRPDPNSIFMTRAIGPAGSD